MANERKTENVVRDHFNKYKSDILIEEQTSDNPKIRKLLSTASKRGQGQGRPEFLLSIKSNPDFIIVVECKADTQKHESPERDNYADFAVDGALLYASYLSKDFDVLAIAVSGETKRDIRVSHFLHLRNENRATKVFADKLLPVADYLLGYLTSPEKFRQDYNSLLSYAKKLNDKLHVLKIPESQRALLISSVLIALDDNAFKASYTQKNTPKSIAQLLTRTVSEKLEEANISGGRLENLNTTFGFIKTNTSLSSTPGVLKFLIGDIDANINNFIKTHQYLDVLGQLYIEFLRYANSDKGLGIVLTPPHITEFFAKVAQVNKNSIVYDNCAGTGGFLISAMSQMVADAKGNICQIKSIKKKQIIGTEYQSHIYALAVSNMYIHQDGKTNIQNGNCFDADIIARTKKQKPTVGFLNPPYKGDKKNDTEELAFVLNNLECLVDGGTCVAIVPMQSALAQSGKILEYKKNLLDKHTLEAVFSMPDELFFNSNVNVVTCVMVFTAHKPHPLNKKTFFGYFKNDGFDKRKLIGRVDVNGLWKERIEQQWLDAFINRENLPGLSVLRSVGAEDEWCAEAYMETDYFNLTIEDFEDTVRQYLAAAVINRFKNVIEVQQILNALEATPNVKLIESNTKFVRLEEIFDAQYGVNLELYKLDEQKCTKSHTIPFVSRSENNNGIAAHVEKRNEYVPNPGHTLSVAGGGSVLATFYQNTPYYSGRDLYYLVPRREMELIEMLFYSLVIRANRYRYNYGRQANKTFKEILVPERLPRIIKDVK